MGSGEIGARSGAARPVPGRETGEQAPVVRRRAGWWGSSEGAHGAQEQGSRGGAGEREPGGLAGW